MHEDLPKPQDAHPEAPAIDWDNVKELYDQQMHLSAIVWGLGFAPLDVRVTGLAKLGVQTTNEAFVYRAQEAIDEQPNSTATLLLRAKAWAALHAASGAEGARQSAIDLTHEADRKTIATDTFVKSIALSTGDVELASGISHPVERAQAFAALADTVPEAYTYAVVAARQTGDANTLARLARQHLDQPLLRHLESDTYAANSYVQMQLFSAAQKTGNAAVMQRAGQHLQSRMSEEPVIVGAMIRQHIHDTSDVGLANVIADPQQRMRALLAGDKHPQFAAILSEVRQFVARAPHDATNLTIALRVAELSGGVADRLRASEMAKAMYARNASLIPTMLHERIARTTQDAPWALRHLAPYAQPLVLASIAQARGDVELLLHAHNVANSIPVKGQRARTQHAIAMICGDHALAQRAIRGADVDTAQELSGASVVSSMTFDVAAMRRIAIAPVKPERDDTTWRRRSVHLGALSVYAGLPGIEGRAREALSPAMRATMISGALRTARVTASATAKLISDRGTLELQDQMANGDSSVGIGRIARALSDEDRQAALSVLPTPNGYGRLTDRRLLSTLIGTYDWRSLRETERLVLDPQASQSLRSYFAVRLATGPYHDHTALRRIDQIRTMLEMPPETLLDITRHVKETHNILLDAPSLEWLLRLPTSSGRIASVYSLQPENTLASVDEALSVARDMAAEVDNITDADELVTVLAASTDMARAYFMAHAGRTAFEAEAGYTPQRFIRFLYSVQAMQSGKKKLYAVQQKFGHMSASTCRDLVEGRPIVRQASWNVESRTLTEAEEQTVHKACGADFLARLAPGARELHPGQLKLVRSMFGETMAEFLTSGTIERQDMPQLLSEIEYARTAVAIRIQDIRMGVRAENLAQAAVWAELGKRVRTGPPELVFAAAVCIEQRNPRKFDKILKGGKWGTRIAEAIELMGVVSSEFEPMRCRVLDKRHNLMEYAHFADGAYNCFNGILTNRPEDVRTASFDRRWKDAAEFVILIEDPKSPDHARVSQGFTFGSIGLHENKPALILNGVYMNNMADRRAAAFMASVRRHVAEPLGLRRIVFAAKAGGEFTPPKEYRQARGTEIMRFSTILDAAGNLTSNTYDDLGTVVNAHGFRAGSGIWYQEW